MQESFLQAVKWYVLTLGVIVGTTAMIISNDSGSHKPVMIAVLGYGLVYTMSYFWTEFRNKLLLAGIVVFLILSFAVPYVPTALYVLYLIDNPAALNEYMVWAGTMGVLGIPIMTLVFNKLD